MHPMHKQRIAFALKCKLEDVPNDEGKLKNTLDERIKELKAKKVKYG
jgi:hypothetical protein